jgi:FecR protein
MKRRCWLCGIGASCVGMPLLASAQAIAPMRPTRLTVQDGAATLVRGIAKSETPLGLVPKDGDLLETTSDTRLVRIEFADRATLELGPATRVWLTRAVGASGREPVKAYLLGGWAKLSATPSAAAALDTPHGLVRTRGASLVEVRAASASVFTESGDASVVPRRSGAASVSLASTEYLLLTPAADAPTAPVPPPMPWLKNVPTALKDKLESRRDRFDGKDIALPPGVPVTYADVQPWLQAEPRVRNALLARWRPLARDARFKAAVVAQMDKHPEWDRVLFPEKYLPREPAASQPLIAPVR